MQFDTCEQVKSCPLTHLCFMYVVYTCTEKVDISVVSDSRYKKMKLATESTFILELNLPQNAQELLSFIDCSTFFSSGNDSSG